jgi:hypothetical protein
MSKEMLVRASQRPGPLPIVRSMPVKKLTALRWLTATPFGLPVEPEV